MKLGKLFVRDLGSMNPYIPEKKEWVATAIGVVGGLASSLLGGAAASRAAKRAEKQQRAAEAADEADYTRKKYEDVADTAWGQRAINRVKTYGKKFIKQAEGKSAVMGSTDASTQQAKDQVNQMVAETEGNLAAANVARQEHADAVHQANRQKYMQMDMQREMNRANSITQAAGAASNAMMSLGSAIDQSNVSNTNLSGGSNESIAFNPPVVEKKADTQMTPMQIYENATDAEKEHFRNALGS